MSKATFMDRVLGRLGLTRASNLRRAAFAGANLSRLNSDWATSLLSSDEEIRGSLTKLRARSRQLANNNDYAVRFINLLKQNVIGPNGIALQSIIEESDLAVAETTNAEIERVWQRWCKPENASADGKLSFIDILQLAVATIAVDGEVFIRLIKGFQHNNFSFALEFIDADHIDVNLNRRRMKSGDGWVNEIRMGVELDQYRRPVAYYISDAHPSEGGSRYRRIPARDESSVMLHRFISRRPNSTRGVPHMHTAMTKMNMLGGYEEAELVAARVAACIMGTITSKTGDDFKGEVNPDSGSVEFALEPATVQQLPEGMKMEMFNPNHPNAAYPDFVRGMLRGMAVGLNVSYASLTGDLRDVNYSSIRQGALDERDGWQVLQTFVIEHICEPIFAEWFAMATLSGQLAVDPKQDPEFYLDRTTWQPRGWTWVDPLKEVKAQREGLAAGFTTHAAIAAAQGRNWKDDYKQLKAEMDYADSIGLKALAAPVEPAAPAPPPAVEEEETEEFTDGN